MGRKRRQERGRKRGGDSKLKAIYLSRKSARLSPGRKKRDRERKSEKRKEKKNGTHSNAHAKKKELKLKKRGKKI